jgi:hypothetical protein
VTTIPNWPQSRTNRRAEDMITRRRRRRRGRIRRSRRMRKTGATRLHQVMDLKPRRNLTDELRIPDGLQYRDAIRQTDGGMVEGPNGGLLKRLLRICLLAKFPPRFKMGMAMVKMLVGKVAEILDGGFARVINGMRVPANLNPSVKLLMHSPMLVRVLNVGVAK